jgi:hypothetical protein
LAQLTPYEVGHQPPELEGYSAQWTRWGAGESAAVDIGSRGLLKVDRREGAHGMHEDADHEDDEFLDRADRFEHAYNFRCDFYLNLCL